MLRAYVDIPYNYCILLHYTSAFTRLIIWHAWLSLKYYNILRVYIYIYIYIYHNMHLCYIQVSRRSSILFKCVLKRLLHVEVRCGAYNLCFLRTDIIFYTGDYIFFYILIYFGWIYRVRICKFRLLFFNKYSIACRPSADDNNA